MPDDLFSAPADAADPADTLALADYAERAYLEYALSVVKGRALPDVCDGQKPVQRRIMYSMARMGLGYSGPNSNTAARPVKSARVVGDVLGRFHRLGAARAREGQAHAEHRIEDAPLDGLVAVAHVRQGAALDDGQRVLEVGALGVIGQRQGVGGVGGA